MNLSELIKSRRTIHRFKAGVTPAEATLRAALEQAAWAPNHHLTQPWRFYLLGAKSKERICRLNAEQVGERQGERAGQLKLKRWRDMPGWLVLTCRRSSDTRVMREDYAACCCVVQNLMLLLWEEGIGMKWTTGDVIRTPAFYEIIRADPQQEEVVGLFWYGYPARVPTAQCRRPGQIFREIL